MKLIIKQRFLSWFDSYNVYRLPEGADSVDFDRAETEYTVEGQLAWGHEFHVNDREGRTLGVLSQEVFTFLPKFHIIIGGEEVGCVEKEFSFFTPKFTLDMRDWQIEGDVFGWDYSVTDSRANTVASVSKELFNFTDTYIINIPEIGRAHV